MSQGKFTESEPLAREALELDRKKQPDNWQSFRVESLLGASLAGEKKYAEAEPLLLEGYQGMLARKDRIAAQDRYHLDLAHPMARPALPSLGQARESCRVEEGVRPGTMVSLLALRSASLGVRQFAAAFVLSPAYASRPASWHNWIP